MIYLDQRWAGSHGIGRVTQELMARLSTRPTCVHGSPSSPLDPIRLSLRIFGAGREDIFLSPGYNVPLIPSRRYLFFIHDLNHIDRRENSSHLKRLYYRFLISRASRSAPAVLTVSDFSRKRIIEWFHLPPRKVINVGNGVGAEFCERGAIRTEGSPYFLTVGNRKAHKNETRLLEAFLMADVAGENQLIFTGPASESLLAIARGHASEARVRFLGVVGEEDLPALYRGAQALLFPSLYEGFGLPVIEAMACGTPVLTSTTTSLPEVAGGAALLVDPESTDEIRAGIEQLATDRALRARLSAAGLERAKLFTWDRVAERVQRVLDDVVAGRLG